MADPADTRDRNEVPSHDTPDTVMHASNHHSKRGFSEGSHHTSSGNDSPAMIGQDIRPLKRARVTTAQHNETCTANNAVRCASGTEDNGVTSTEEDPIGTLKTKAALLRDQQKFGEARDVLEQVLPLVTGQALMETLTDLGSLCADFGDLDSSMNYHNLALNMYLDQSNSQAACAPCYGNLAIVNLRHVAAIYLRFNRCQEALLCYTFIYKIQQETVRAPLQEMASTLSCIGLMHYLMERFPEALRFYQEELRLRLQLHDGDMEHEDVAIALNSIGIVYFQLENLDQARQSFQSCLQIRQRLLGDGCSFNKTDDDDAHASSSPSKMTSDPHCCCYDLAMVYFNLAAIAMKQSDDDQAARLYHRSMELKKAVFGPHHPEIAVDYQYLGQLFLDHGDSQTAIEYYTEAHKVVQILGNSAAGDNGNQQAKSAAQKLLVIIGNIHLLDANVQGMMSSFQQAARLETSEDSGREFMEQVRVFGYHLYSISRMHPPCAAEA
ncbi:Kinesin light chain [Seminavis robusta]|uniref:Kinesin light chain n=1 Tax=Seminavis robusta TaxID=568900 RepID=A0A9N8EXN2_9STRA|nr:Kinesin light chain [Seminavis robusta]|eukprot:Sro1914_g305080.1 Kinesin light chain (495) ;mRNA; r:15508-16992